MIIYSDPLLILKTHNNLNLRNKIIKFLIFLIISIFLHGKDLHRLILLQIWPKISLAIGYGRLYFTSVAVNFLHAHSSTRHQLTTFVEIKKTGWHPKRWNGKHFMVCVVMGLDQVMLSAFWFNTSWLRCFWRENCHVSLSHWLRPCLNPVRKLPPGIRSWTIQLPTLYPHSIILTLKGHEVLMHVQYDISRASASLQNISFKFGGLKLHLVHYLMSRMKF